MTGARVTAVLMLLAATAVAAVAAAAAPDGGAAADAANDAAATGDAGADAAAANVDGATDAGGADATAVGDAQAPPALPPAVIATVPVRGRVLQKGTRRPLAGVSIAVDGATAAETDAQGRFELRVAPGAHRLQVQLSGHDDADQAVDAGAGADAEVLFRLAPRLTGER